MNIAEIRSYIKDIEENSSLFEEKNFDRRIETIDFLEFHVIDQIEARVETRELNLLKQRAEEVTVRLGQVDDILFEKLRANIRAGICIVRAFKDLVNEYFDLDSKVLSTPGYDNLDLFINRLICFDTMPGQTKELETGMVFYQKTPARIIFELAKKCHFTNGDVFFDLGSGLGQVAILLNLLTGVTARGIEFEPAFCRYAQDCAAALNLPEVTFINTDACKADFSAGTVFFLYTPFTGEMLQDVLELLREESKQRMIRIVTYGPCTEQVAQQSWLHPDSPLDNNIYRLAFFNSI